MVVGDGDSSPDRREFCISRGLPGLPAAFIKLPYFRLSVGETSPSQHFVSLFTILKLLSYSSEVIVQSNCRRAYQCMILPLSLCSIMAGPLVSWVRTVEQLLSLQLFELMVSIPATPSREGGESGRVSVNATLFWSSSLDGGFPPPCSAPANYTY